MHFFLIDEASKFSFDNNINVNNILVLDHVTDLGICNKSDYHSHIHIITTRAFQRFDLIYKGFVSRDKHILTLAYITYARFRYLSTELISYI